MNQPVPRTCRELPPESDTTSLALVPSQGLSAFREHTAYVLLGDAGAGKTTAFKTEAQAIGPEAILVRARQFIRSDDPPTEHPEWIRKTLFIDALDEQRPRSIDPRTAIDKICTNLLKLGRPRFRLSCRHADWLGATDQAELTDPSPDGRVVVLALDPLTETDARTILQDSHAIADPADFIREARQRGLDGLLTNPQTLTLLANVVHHGRWPAGRAQTFELACEELAREHNQHRWSLPGGFHPRDLVQSAGNLSALLLLSDTLGVARDRSTESDDYPSLDSLSHSPESRAAVATPLFVHPEDGRAHPLHRHIAEYLAARRIAALMDQGLPCGRALALMNGPDGTVVSQLRGLSGWLATLSQHARLQLITVDPVGVGLYGDVGAFSTEEKHALLDALAPQARMFVYEHQSAAAFAPIATAEMQQALCSILQDPRRDTDQQAMVVFVLDLLLHATGLSEIRDLILRTIRDDTRWPRIQIAALKVHLRFSEEPDPEPLRLLSDIHRGRLADPDDELLGKLLTALYPASVAPAEIWNYLREGEGLYIGSYWLFWSRHLADRSIQSATPTLLDAAVDRAPQIQAAFTSRRIGDTLAVLLARGLNEFGDELELPRLYNWLGVCAGVPDGGHIDEAARSQIKQWLSARPDTLIAIMQEALANSPESELWQHSLALDRRLYDVHLPTQVAEWCIHHALSIAPDSPLAAEYLTVRAICSNHLEHADLRLRTEGNETLSAVVDALLPRRAPPPRSEPERRQPARTAERHSREQHINELAANRQSLLDNAASSVLLQRLAFVYFNQFAGFHPARGPSAIFDYTGSDREMTDIILDAFRSTIRRSDVPHPSEVLPLLDSSPVLPLAWPYLAGLAEAERTASFDPSWWNEEAMQRALAFYFAYAHGDYEPAWYQNLLHTRPDIVAEWQVRFAGTCITLKRSATNANVWHLANDDAHRHVARLSSLRLLRSFPTRAQSSQLSDLTNLLLAAIQHAPPGELAELIGTTLSRSSISVAQRARWLAAGLAVDPLVYGSDVATFLHAGQQVQRASSFGALFFASERPLSQFDRHDPRLPTHLISLLGRHVGPDEFTEGVATPAIDLSRLVARCIHRLATNPEPTATRALDQLCREPPLPDWGYSLNRARHEQRVLSRDHAYSHPTIAAVKGTLSDDGPANAADLHALVQDRIERVALQIRTSDANLWRPYWQEDRGRQRDTPKHEDSCRDALLAQLRPLLPGGAEAIPEGRYVNDKRADIRVTANAGAFSVPVELKKDSHRELWTSLHKQLIAKYTTDPATDGFGLYVVLCFGNPTVPLPGKPPATSPAEIQSLLLDSLSLEERRKTSVLTIDLT